MRKIIKILLMFAVIVSAISSGLAQTQMSVRRTVHPNPMPLTVSSYGTTHCAGTPGPEIYMNTTQSNTTYQMWQDLQTDILLSTQPGNGGYVNFGETNDGTMYVFATNNITGCTNTMANTITITSLAIPTVEITASGAITGCGTVNVTLNVDYEYGCTYQWYVNDVIIPGAISNTYTASVTNATKVFTCTATNGDDCEASDFIIVTSNPYPDQFDVTGTTSFCPGDGTVTVQGTTSGGDVVYHLGFGGTTINTVTGTGAAHSWGNLTQTGTYTVTAENIMTGCSLVMGSVYIQANPLPAAAGTISGPSEACQGDALIYSIVPVANATSYNWGTPTWTTIVSGQGTSQITLLVLESGVSGNVTVFGQNDCGSGQPNITSLTVWQSPTVNASADHDNLCEGQSSTLNVVGNGISFLWSTGATTQNISVTPNVTTTYTVTVTGAHNCTATGAATVVVHPLPSVSLNLPQDHFCPEEQPITVSGGSPAGGTYTSSGCIFNGQFIPASTTAGNYTVTYTYTDGYGCPGSASQDVTFNQAVLPVFLNVPGPIYTNTPGFYLTGYVSPSGGTFSGPGVYGNMFNPAIAGPGTHQITYTYIHPITGCAGTQIQWIVVVGGNDPGNSIESVAAANAVAIYPNPASEILNLTGINTQQIISLQVVDLTGRVVYENKNLDEEVQIDLNEFTPGNYIIRFIATDGSSASRKFIKE